MKKEINLTAIDPPELKEIEVHWNRVPSAIIAFNHDCGILSANHIARIMFGYQEKDISLKKLTELIHSIGKTGKVDCLDPGFIKAFLTDIKIGHTKKYDINGKNNHGFEFPVQLFLSKAVYNKVTIPLAVIDDVIQLQNIERNKGQISLMLNNVIDTFYRKIFEFQNKDLTKQGKFDMVGKMQAYLLGASSPTEVNGKTDFDYFSREHSLIAYEDELKIIKFGLPLVSKEERLTDREGRFMCYVTANKSAVWNEDQSDIIGISGFSRDITEMKRLQEELIETRQELENVNHRLKIAATIDSLTGLYNRSFFEEFVKSEVQKRDSSFALLAFDLNHLKFINDRFGHSAGDELIKTFAEILQSNVRMSDKIARMGGDEFYILVLNIGDTICSVIKNIFDCLENKSIPYSDEKGLPLKITTGVGVVRYSSNPGDRHSFHTRNYDDLIRMADIALYHAKSESRLKEKNSFVHFKTGMKMPEI